MATNKLLKSAASQPGSVQETGIGVDSSNNITGAGTINGLIIGTDVQAYDAQLSDIASLTVTAANTIVANGSNWIAQKNELAKTTAPTVNDDTGDGYTVGSRWIDTTNDKEYVCLDASSGAAVWSETTNSGTSRSGLASSGDSTVGTKYEYKTIEGNKYLALKLFKDFSGFSRTVAAADSEYNWTWDNRGEIASANEDTTTADALRITAATTTGDWYAGPYGAARRTKNFSFSTQSTLKPKVLLARISNNASTYYTGMGIQITQSDDDATFLRYQIGYAASATKITSYLGTSPQETSCTSGNLTDGIWLRITLCDGTAYMDYNLTVQATPPTTGWVRDRSASFALNTAKTYDIGLIQIVNASSSGLESDILYYDDSGLIEETGDAANPVWCAQGYDTSNAEVTVLADFDLGTSAPTLDQAMIRKILADAENKITGDSASWTYVVKQSSSTGATSSGSSFAAAGSVTVDGTGRYANIFAKCNSNGTQSGSLLYPIILPVVATSVGGGGTITLSGDVSGSGTSSITTTIGAGKVTEAMQVLADNTTGNVSTTKHGYAPKAPNDATKYLDGTGAWTVPSGGGGSSTEIVSLIASQVNISSEGQTYTDTAGDTYAEMATQTRLTLTGSRNRVVQMAVSGHVNAGTGTFQLWNHTDSSSLGTATTTSTVEAAITIVTSRLATNVGDQITIRVKNSVAGNTVTIDNGGMIDSDIGFLAATSVGLTTAGTFAGGFSSSYSIGILKRLSTDTFTAYSSHKTDISGSYPNHIFPPVRIGGSFSQTSHGTVVTRTPTGKFYGSVTLELTALSGTGVAFGVSSNVKTDDI